MPLTPQTAADSLIIFCKNRDEIESLSNKLECTKSLIEWLPFGKFLFNSPRTRTVQDNIQRTYLIFRKQKHEILSLIPLCMNADNNPIDRIESNILKEKNSNPILKNKTLKSNATFCTKTVKQKTNACKIINNDNCN